MPKMNNAAQAAEQEIDAIMEQAQVFASAWAFLGGPFDNGSGLEQAEREKANLRALLSKLRAPVADERAAVDPCGYVTVKVSAVDWLKDKFPALTIKAGLCERIGGRLYTITRLMRDHDAALASAPVDDAGNWQQYRLRGSNETAEQIIERERMAYADLLQSVMDKRRERASAPVAGEAQPEIEQMAVNRYRPVPDGKFSYKVVAGDGSRSLYTGTKDSCLRVAAKLTEAFLDGAFVASDAAPQASAENVRLRELLVRCQAWMLSSEHDRPNMLIALIQDALQSQPQADKDGGQQRAGDDLIHALGECRDAFPTPDIAGSRLDLLWQEAMSDPTAVPAYVKACAARAALASAPVDDAGNWQQYRLRGSNETAEQIIERERMAYADLLQSVMDKRRERASAPVAGEAQPFMYGIMGPDGKAHFEEFCVSGDRDELQAEVVDHLNRDNPEDRPFSVVALFRDAAPKASAEDVRNAALEEAARMMEQTGKRIAASDIRALKQPQGKPPAPSQATDKEQA